MLKATVLVTVALSLFVTRPAAADSKSWTAVKRSVSPKAAIVFGFNLDPIRATGSYAAALKMFLAESNEANQAFELIKTSCQIDVATAISDATVIMKLDEKPLVVLGLNGLDEPKVIDCMEKIVKSFAGGGPAPTLTAKKKGKVTEYSAPGEAKKIYVAWLAADVVAFTDDPGDKGKLTKMLTGGAAKGALGTMIGKVSTSAAVWAAVVKKADAPFGTFTGGYGAVEISGGTISASGHMTLSKPAEATAGATAGNAKLVEAKAEFAKIPAAVKLMDTIKIVASGKLIDITGSIADKDILALLPQLESIF